MEFVRLVEALIIMDIDILKAELVQDRDAMVAAALNLGPDVPEKSYAGPET